MSARVLEFQASLRDLPPGRVRGTLSAAALDRLAADAFELASVHWLGCAMRVGRLDGDPVVTVRLAGQPLLRARAPSTVEALLDVIARLAVREVSP